MDKNKCLPRAEPVADRSWRPCTAISSPSKSSFSCRAVVPVWPSPASREGLAGFRCACHSRHWAAFRAGCGPVVALWPANGPASPECVIESIPEICRETCNLHLWQPACSPLRRSHNPKRSPSKSQASPKPRLRPGVRVRQGRRLVENVRAICARGSQGGTLSVIGAGFGRGRLCVFGDP